jgi:hypothetical protein
MTTGEKLVINSFVAVVLALLAWALLYFPALVYRKLAHLDWLLTGRSPPNLAMLSNPAENFGNNGSWPLIKLPPLSI